MKTSHSKAIPVLVHLDERELECRLDVGQLVGGGGGVAHYISRPLVSARCP